MITLKCPKCGNKREVTVEQLKTIQAENRHCPSCSQATERVLVQEEKFQTVNDFLAGPQVVHVSSDPLLHFKFKEPVLPSDEAGREIDVPVGDEPTAQGPGFPPGWMGGVEVQEGAESQEELSPEEAPEAINVGPGGTVEKRPHRKRASTG